MIAMPMPASPQNSSSIATGSVSPVGSPMAFEPGSRQPYRPISAASCTTGHGNSSRLVPLLGGGADDALGEVVNPLLDLQLVFVEGEREVGHGHKLPAGNVDVHLSATFPTNFASPGDLAPPAAVP